VTIASLSAILFREITFQQQLAVLVFLAGAWSRDGGSWSNFRGKRTSSHKRRVQWAISSCSILHTYIEI